MKISEFIKKLQKIQEKNGDLEVTHQDGFEEDFHPPIAKIKVKDISMFDDDYRETHDFASKIVVIEENLNF